MKKKLRESLIMPEQKPLHHEPQKSIQLRPNQNKEVLKVSPTTKLPTKFDRIQVLYEYKDYKVELNLSYTNTSNNQLERGKIDYSDGKYHPVPDARSIVQWTQYARGDYGLGVYVGDDAADWLKKVRKYTTPSYGGFDIDPVRAIQRHKARKRQEKVNRILKAYEQD